MLCVPSLMSSYAEEREMDREAAMFRGEAHSYFSNCTPTSWELEENDSYYYDSIRIHAIRDNEVDRIRIRKDYYSSEIQVTVYRDFGLVPVSEFTCSGFSEIENWLTVTYP